LRRKSEVISLLDEFHQNQVVAEEEAQCPFSGSDSV
jgi:hypothetical protein